MGKAVAQVSVVSRTPVSSTLNPKCAGRHAVMDGVCPRCQGKECVNDVHLLTVPCAGGGEAMPLVSRQACRIAQ
eukprot:4151464-Alexandrium_andersonii.AAC.1